MRSGCRSGQGTYRVDASLALAPPAWRVPTANAVYCPRRPGRSSCGLTGPQPRTGVRVDMHRILAIDPGITIPLTNGGEAIVDTNTSEEIRNRRWTSVFKDNTWYVRELETGYYLHREILDARPGQEIDHINRNGLDNRTCNLRFCTSSQNKMNRGRQRNNYSSEYKGVTWDREKKRWLAQLVVNGERKLAKRFRSEEEAARAYDEASREYHGEFGFLNFGIED